MHGMAAKENSLSKQTADHFFEICRGGKTREEERRFLLLCFVAVFFWGLAAHAYGFLHAGFSHDMLNALVTTPVETYWKMQLGRPGIVLYRRVLRGLVAAPWQLGILSLIWLSLSCFLTSKLFSDHSQGRAARGKLFPILLAGILTVNLSTISMTAGFLYEMDADLFAMLAGVCAVFLWDRFGWKGTLIGILPITFCMGTYQSIVSVPITLIMLLSMASLLQGDGFSSVFRKGLRGIAMLAFGALLYWLLVRAMCALEQINLSMDSYNRVSGDGTVSILTRISRVYKSWFWAFWNPDKAHIEPLVRILNVLLPALCALRLLPWLFTGEVKKSEANSEKTSGRKEKLLFLVLLALLPLGMNTAQLAFSVEAHDLMKYAFWLFWLLCLMPFFLLPPIHLPAGHTAEKIGKPAAVLMVFVILLSNIQTANVLYTRKQLEQDACLSLMTRVVARLEAREDYIPGETELVFFGVSEELNEKMPGFENTYDIGGGENSSPLVKSVVTYYYNVYAAYFRYILNNPAVMAPNDVWNTLQEDVRVEEMPCYPAEGCMQMIDGVMVVKLGPASAPVRGDFPWM